MSSAGSFHEGFLSAGLMFSALMSAEATRPLKPVESVICGDVVQQLCLFD